MATETPVGGKVKHLLLKRMSFGLKLKLNTCLAQLILHSGTVKETLQGSKKLNWVVEKHLLPVNWMNDHDYE